MANQRKTPVPKASLSSFVAAAREALAGLGYASPKTQRYECSMVTSILLAAAERCGWAGSVAFGHGLVKGEDHVFLVLGDTVVDFTYGQFDPEATWPLVVSMDEAKLYYRRPTQGDSKVDQLNRGMYEGNDDLEQVVNDIAKNAIAFS